MANRPKNSYYALKRRCTGPLVKEGTGLKSTQKKSMKEKRSNRPEPFYDTVESPIGTLYLIFTGKLLGEIDFKRPVDIPRKGGVSLPIQKELEEYFGRGKDAFNQKIDLSVGTEFERKVWLALKEVPFGERRTYKWLAEKVGKPQASRAVG